MQSPALSWDDLRLAVLAAELGSLSAVARRADLSVATVGRRLERLEETIGTRLFHRHSAGLTPTPEAALLLARASAIAEKVEDFARAAAAGTHDAEGVVTLSTLETVVTHVLAPRLARFREAHPRIELVMHSSARIVRLERRAADLAIRVVRPNEPRVVGKKLGTLRFGLYATDAYLERRGRIAARARDLSGHDIVMYDAAWNAVPEMAWLAARMADTPAAFRVTTGAAMRETIRAGAALGLLPTFLATEEMIELLPANRLPTRDLWLVMHEDLRDAPHVRAVADFVTEAVREVLDR